MARLKTIQNRMFFNDLYQVFNFETHEELEKYRTRLFPLGKTTDEVQTTSIFLSSLSAVKEYREELFTQIGVKKIINQNIQLHTFSEIPCNNGEDRPDGLIVVTSGMHNPIIEWIGFIEVKIGNNPIDANQIERYIKFAKEIKVENIITLSNQLVSTPFDSPININKRIKMNLFHWSWIYLSVTAGRLLKIDAVKDEDHVYILTELRKYFDTHNGIKNYTGMEKSWKDATESFMDKSTKSIIDEIILSYKQEEKDICLQLTDDTGHYIKLKINTTKSREEEMFSSLDKYKKITSTFYIEEKPKLFFYVEIEFDKRRITCYTRYSIAQGKAKAQTTKLINLLTKDDISTEDDIYIGALYARRNSSKSNFESLAKLLKEKDESTYSILNKEWGEEVKEFEIKMSDDLGKDLHRPQMVVNRLESLAKVFLEKVFILLK